MCGCFGDNYGDNYDQCVAGPPTGVIIQNTHSTVLIQDVPEGRPPQPLTTYTFHSKSQIFRIRKLGAVARITKFFNLSGKLAKFITKDFIASARIVVPFTVLTEAKTFRKVSAQEAELFDQAAELKKKKHNLKKERLRSLIEKLEEFDEDDFI